MGYTPYNCGFIFTCIFDEWWTFHQCEPRHGDDAQSDVTWCGNGFPQNSMVKMAISQVSGVHLARDALFWIAMDLNHGVCTPSVLGAEDDDGRCYGGCKKQEIQKCVTKATFGYIQHHSASFRGFLSHGTPPTHPFQQDFPLKKSHPWLRNPPLCAWRCQGSASPVPETSQGDDKAWRQRHPPNVFFHGITYKKWMI